MQRQNNESDSPDKLNPPSKNSPPGPVYFAGTAQNQGVSPNPGLQDIAIGPIQGSAAMKQQLPVPVATIANQPVIANPTSQGYQIGSTTIDPDGAVAVFSGISVYANPAGELVPGDKTYSPPPSALVELTGSTADIVHDEASGSYPVKGAVVTAGAGSPTADGVVVAIQMGLNGGPKSIAIGDKSFALPSMQPSQRASEDGNVVVAEASAVYDADGKVVTAGGSTVRASGMAVPVSTGSEGSAVVGNQAVAVFPANYTRTLGGGVITSPGASVTTARGTAGTSANAGSSTAQVQVDKAQRGAESRLMWMLLCGVVIWGFALLF